MKDSSYANRSCTMIQSARRIISFVANAPNSAREPGLSGMTMTREATRAISSSKEIRSLYLVDL
jgi:hypothetical protein